MSEEILRLENICKSFKSGDGELEILKDINLTVKKGERVAITGKSGSGKSTLLSLAALIDKPTSGRVFYYGKSDFSEDEKASLRSHSIGFIFQNSLLLNDFSALENVAFPLLVRGVKAKEAYKMAEELLEHVGLKGRMNHRPDKLSGGEKQRVAIARAVIGGVDIVFADEPTGALDEESGKSAENLLLTAVGELGPALVLVTHNNQLAFRCERVYSLSHKELIREK